MLALLPLRGWAVASMMMPATSTGNVAAVVALPAASEAPIRHGASSTAPCHPTADDDPSGSAANACTLCDLCHSASSVSPEIALPATPVPDAPPRPGLAFDTGRHAVGGLERPPRVA